MMDLHVHTTASDGATHPKRILDEAAYRNLTLVAITDHDTTAGLRTLLEPRWIGGKHGRAARLTVEGQYVSLLPGIEVSATHSETGRSVHILGYGVDVSTTLLEDALEPIRLRRTYYAEMIVSQLSAAGINISWDDVLAQVYGSTAVFKTHIMDALRNKGYIRSWNQAPHIYRELFGPGGLGHIHEIYMDVREAIKLIVAAAGIPVVAHPGASGIVDLLPQLVDWGIQGIEAFHPDHSPEVVDACTSFGRQRGLYLTGGSDYHGGYARFYKQNDGPLGGAPDIVFIPPTELFALDLINSYSPTMS